MSAWQSYPNMMTYIVGEDGTPENGTLAVEMSDCLDTIDQLRAEIERLRAIPPHPAHIPWLWVGSGVMLRAESGQWIMVLPEEPK